MVLDLKFVNTHFTVNKVKFENLNILRYAPKETSVAISIDVSDAYHHLRLDPRIVKYF